MITYTALRNRVYDLKAMLHKAKKQNPSVQILAAIAAADALEQAVCRIKAKKRAKP